MFNLFKIQLFSDEAKFLLPLGCNKKEPYGEQAGRVHIDDVDNAFINVEDDDFQRILARQVQALSRYWL